MPGRSRLKDTRQERQAMSQRVPPTPRPISYGAATALGVLAALLLCATTSAEPPRGGQAPEEDQPPLFNPLLPHPEPTAAGGVALASTPATGPFSFLGTLYGGDQFGVFG